jgi:hypothetical protein
MADLTADARPPCSGLDLLTSTPAPPRAIVLATLARALLYSAA